MGFRRFPSFIINFNYPGDNQLVHPHFPTDGRQSWSCGDVGIQISGNSGGGGATVVVVVVTIQLHLCGQQDICLGQLQDKT